MAEVSPVRVSCRETAWPILGRMDRTALRTHLDHLDAAVPALLKSCPDRCHFWQAFAGMAEVIEARALSLEDARFVGRRIDEILAWHGLEERGRDG